MRTTFLLFLLFFLNFSFAQPSFQGILELKMSTSEKPEMGRTKFYFSEWGSRLESEMKFSPNMKALKSVRINKKENKDVYYILNDEDMSYFISDLSKYKAVERPDDKVSVKVIGEEKLGGYSCKHVIVTTKSGDTEMWTTRELMNYDDYKKINESDVRTRNTSVAKALIEADAEGFPVKTLKKDSKGGTIVIELVKAEKKQLEKSLFTVPGDYTKTEAPVTGMEGMMQEIKQMGQEALKENEANDTEEVPIEK